MHDAAVLRRIDLFRAAGQDLVVAGFRRRDVAGEHPSRAATTDLATTDLGKTEDGRLLRRIFSVLRHVLSPARVRGVTAGAEVVVARNLESLVLARRVLRGDQRLVYECLDIHRLLLGDGIKTRVIERIERWAMAQVSLVIVSSPLFRDAYFRARRGYAHPVLLVENKVPALDDVPARRLAPPVDGPWVIGWFGMLRCRRSFAALCRLAQASEGRIEVVIAGRPSPAEFADFEAAAAAAPGIRFAGSYTPADLPRLFGSVHFVWAIDYFEAGLNSAWLLPNRLYEGLAHGAVPVAQRGVATAEWLEQKGVGVSFDDPENQLGSWLATLDAAQYARLREAVARLPAETVLMGSAEARRIAETMTRSHRTEAATSESAEAWPGSAAASQAERA